MTAGHGSGIAGFAMRFAHAFSGWWIMRIATGGISHETSTQVASGTTMRDFENGFGLFRGPVVVNRFRRTNTCTGGFIDGAAAHVFQLIPLLWTFAYPGGLIRRDDYE